MGQRDAEEISGEFLDVLNDVAGTHAIAVMGVIQVRDWATKIELAKRTPESSIFIGHGDPNSAQGFAYQRWRLDTLADRLDGNGPVARDLGQQWIVMVAAHWNDHYRQRIANALGIAKNEVADPVMADLNRMRNDVVHHRGVATAKNTGRCEVLRWFEPGETVRVMMAHIAEFMHYVGLVDRSSEIGGGRWEIRGGF
jgi:hypothetical protein